MYANWWSSCRYNSYNAWYSNGNYGIFNNNNFSNSYGVVPVLQLKRLNKMELEKLIKSLRLAEKNKKRNPIRVEFELHKYRNLLSLKTNIESHFLEPSAFAYVVYNPVIREVFSSPMEMCIIDHYLDEQIRPNLELWLNPSVYNNRKGRGLESELSKICDDIAVISKGYTQDCWCIVCDIAGYFPNANLDRAYNILEPLLLRESSGDSSELTYLLRIALYTNHEKIERRSPISCWWDIQSSKSIFSKPFGTGAMPGKLIMQTAMTCYHNSVINWVLDQGVCSITVYGDDILFVVSDKERFLNYIFPEFRAKMSDIGCTIHPRKFYCQHYSKGVKFCSQMIKIERKYVGKRTLYNFRKKLLKFKGKSSINRLNYFLSMVNSYLGFAKHRNSYGIIKGLMKDLDEGWKELTVFDEETRTLRAKPEYNYRALLTKKYNIKIAKQYDKSRNRRASKRAARTATRANLNNEH